MEIGTRTDNNPLYRKLRTVHKDMRRRCLNKNAKSYELYGGKGITISKEWETLNGFLATVDLVDGWDKDTFLTTGLSLDKDLKGGAEYSITNCTWMPLNDNKSLLSMNYRNVCAIDPNGRYYVIDNIDKFCREHNLNHSNIVQVINGRYKHHKLWVFWYEGDKPKKGIQPHIAVSPLGDTYYFYKAPDMEKYGLNSKCVARCLRGERTKHKGWKFIKSENL
ncbi:putative HMH homimg endonuclease [Enterococcus phage vB_EfaH_149]|uniref:HMH homimg endonuclease n=1 Tax=Enterococcus phage vB_EfaH_149 TaxID=2730535 RepID=A0ACA9ASZ5_9CAUD|nr:hypothetical protein [Enterococcus phage 156]CAD0300314.1 putative HMH homimg endonuclease [Enterococcus phage vB_EfaH_149]VDB76854.1 hypothetical protein PHI156_065 [Enterococcus phage 156]